MEHELSHIEKLSAELIRGIIDIIPESIFHLRSASKTLRDRVDTYVSQVQSSRLIDRLAINGAHKDGHWPLETGLLYISAHIHLHKADLFELRLKHFSTKLDADVANKISRKEDDNERIYSMVLNVKDEEMIICLRSSIGALAEQRGAIGHVDMKECEHIWTFVSTLLEGMSFFKLSVWLISALSDSVINSLLKTIADCKVDNLHLIATENTLADAVSFLHEISGLVRCLSITQYGFDGIDQHDNFTKRIMNYFFGKYDFDWAPVISLLFSRKMDTLRIWNRNYPLFLSKKGFNLLKKSLPKKGKKIWFEAGNHTLGEEISYFDNDHSITVTSDWANIKHVSRIDEEQDII